MSLALAGVVLGAVGLISGFIGSKKASKAAKEQAALEAEQERLITGERIRQLGKEERAMYGETVAGYAGGGVLSQFGTMGGTPTGAIGAPKSVLQEQANEFQREREITQKVGATKVAQGLARGKATAEAYKFAGYSNAAQGIANILSSYAVMKG